MSISSALLFVDSFRQWQRRFRCPKCNGSSLDFIINDKIDQPFICTHYLTYFNFKEINRALQNKDKESKD